MSSLLLRNLRTILTCDDGDAVLEHVDLYCENGIIRVWAQTCPRPPDTVIDGSHCWCYPGLINTHHHLYQIFSRNLPEVQKLELFDWLTALYEMWKGLDEEVVPPRSLTGMGELLKHGCTTCFDHHYVFPAGRRGPDRRPVRAPRRSWVCGCSPPGAAWTSPARTAACRRTAWSRPWTRSWRTPRRVIEVYHDPRPGSMRQVALAPCSPFSVSGELLRQSARAGPAVRRAAPHPSVRDQGRGAATPWSTTACGPWSIWRLWAGQARTCGTPTASTSTTRSCGSWPGPAPAWPTAPSPT